MEFTIVLMLLIPTDIVKWGKNQILWNMGQITGTVLKHRRINTKWFIIKLDLLLFASATIFNLISLQNEKFEPSNFLFWVQCFTHK